MIPTFLRNWRASARVVWWPLQVSVNGRISVVTMFAAMTMFAAKRRVHIVTAALKGLRDEEGRKPWSFKCVLLAVQHVVTLVA